MASIFWSMCKAASPKILMPMTMTMTMALMMMMMMMMMMVMVMVMMLIMVMILSFGRRERVTSRIWGSSKRRPPASRDAMRGGLH